MTPAKPTTAHAPKKTTAHPVAHKAVKPAVAHVAKAPVKTDRYYQGRGGRKTATASVRVHPKGSGITVNGRAFATYFPTLKMQTIITSPLILADMKDVGVTVVVSGGGLNAQAGAVRHGIARALVALDAELRKKLKRAGFMTRDPRHVERKKYGLKKARRAPQWAKR